MKKIILIRHGKSAWDQPFLSDHDRPLADRGLRDLPKMAKRLQKREIFPDLILSSSAVRAVETAKITAEALGIEEEKIVVIDKLYHASAHTILKYIKMQHDSINTLFVVGHNPGFNELIEYLGGKLDNLPTSGQFGFKVKSEHWADTDPKTTEFWFMDYPKKIH
ncbi:phosphohistidine phosphatase [Algoriphagus boseongensis]|uniref:Phosphohistidine phosphatase n=1 Tax=Algoriphagus boseongensis TaxID=1442587 RepID=A0A4R6T423_9BACT|nr:histidine phosphatase family protein [Algoriphagus boseongensis]TDQ16407.1 phosphohistidine phosphatase [Algoriphagus boseongensis]